MNLVYFLPFSYFYTGFAQFFDAALIISFAYTPGQQHNDFWHNICDFLMEPQNKSYHDKFINRMKQRCCIIHILTSKNGHKENDCINFSIM